MIHNVNELSWQLTGRQVFCHYWINSLIPPKETMLSAVTDVYLQNAHDEVLPAKGLKGMNETSTCSMSIE